MKKQELTEKITALIEEKKEEIIAIGEAIYKEPETGFREVKTTQKVVESLENLGLKVRTFRDITGAAATFDTGKEGPHIAIMGELDAVINTQHPDADQKTGAVHACGHHVQIAAMIGSAIGLLLSDAQSELCGKITFVAVPAEEFIEVEFRNDLKKKGTIKYLGGKAEFLHRGIFDTIDLCMMMHVSTKDTHKVYFPKGTNGFITKSIKYIGKSSHAGAAPEEGINALYAANVGLMAANALRETFKEEDCIRFHPIITKGGDVVNVIPGEVHIEAQLRGRTMEAVTETNKKINRAFIGGAIAMGAEVEIEDIPGYMPFNPNKALDNSCKKVLDILVGKEDYVDESHGTYSLDIGDLSALMPALHPFVKGARDVMHGSDYKITDPETAYLVSAKMLAITAAELLWENGQTAKEIIRSYQPVFKDKQEYFTFVDKLFSKNIFSMKDIVSKEI